MLVNQNVQSRTPVRPYDKPTSLPQKLLFIEDDGNYASHICAILSSPGEPSFDVTHMPSADYALSLLAVAQSQFAIVLFDAGTLTADALHTVAELGSATLRSETALVVLADIEGERTAQKVVGLGADDCIARPHLSAKLLPSTLSQVVMRKRLTTTMERMVMTRSTQSPIEETIVEASPLGFAYIDRDLTIRLVNHSYAQIWQGTPTTSLNRPLYSVAPCLASHAEAHHRALLGEPHSFQDCKIVDPITGHTCYYDIHYLPVRTGYGEISGFVSAAVDLTERHDLDTVKDELLMYAAHELKTPLTSLKGFAQLALGRAEVSGDPKLIEYLEAVNRQVNQVNRLASSLLDLSRIEHGMLRLEADCVDFVELVRSVVHRYKMSRADFTFTLTLPPTPIWLRADRQLIEQVLSNLIDNGIKYALDDKWIEIALKVEGCTVVTSVRDFGMGIPPGERDRVFERFFRATNGSRAAKSGLGIGLYISHDIVTRHGGRIWLEEITPPGCEFRFSLPVSKVQNAECIM